MDKKAVEAVEMCLQMVEMVQRQYDISFDVYTLQGSIRAVDNNNDDQFGCRNTLAEIERREEENE